ncbi:MAG TPA: DUF4203 domain-containing protein [Candidatus Hydrogenedens sp.]|nr:DUF4203 domain-containing protein [Candidatus Hydrogenedens sp.]
MFLIMCMGFLSCFFGYSLVYIIIGLCGFFTVAFSSLLSFGFFLIDLTPVVIVVSFVLGLLGVAIAVFFFKLGIFILGVLGGYALGLILLPVINNPLLLFLIGLAGGFLSFIVEKIVIITATAVIGSLVIVWSIVRLIELWGVIAITPEFEPSYIQMLCMLAWFGFTALGSAFQYKNLQIKIQRGKKR